MKTLASMSEIVRVGGWALRGAGFPFGVAERGTRLLAWTEAVHGGAVRDICAQEETIARAASARGMAPARRADGGWEIDGGGRHLIEAGPPLVDLATSDARLRSEGHARLRDVNGFIFVTALADLLAQRRLTALCVYRTPEGEGLPPSLERSGWILAGPQDDRTIFAAGQIGDPLSRRIRDVFGRTALGPAVSADLAEAASPGAGYLAVTALATEHEAVPQLTALLDRSEDRAARRDYAERVLDAYRNGVPMEPQDLQDLYDLEIRTWAPTSERSRSQAGYGKF